MGNNNLKKGFMYEKLSPITTGHMNVTKEQKKESGKRIKEAMKKINKRLKEINKVLV